MLEGLLWMQSEKSIQKIEIKHIDQKRKNSFNKSERIVKRSEYVQLSKTGKKFHNRHFLALYQLNSKNVTRLGITVTKKVGNAAIRNRIKRLTRECFRLNKHYFTNSMDISIIAKKESAIESSKEVTSSLQFLLYKLSRIKRR